MFNYKKIIQKIKFNPPWWGVINPFYFARKNLYKHIKYYAPQLGGNLLDIGCGSKPYENLFLNLKKYLGLELENQKSEGSVADYFYDGKKIPFDNETYESIFCTQVLEHVFEPDNFLYEISRVLKKDGLMIITLPFIWDEHEQPFDYARYTSFGLKYILEKNNFKVVKQVKICNNFSAIIQIINCYFYKKLCFKKFFLLKFIGIIIISILNILGILLSFLPRNNDLYLDNFILAKKNDE